MGSTRGGDDVTLPVPHITPRGFIRLQAVRVYAHGGASLSIRVKDAKGYWQIASVHALRPLASDPETQRRTLLVLFEHVAMQYARPYKLRSLTTFNRLANSDRRK